MEITVKSKYLKISPRKLRLSVNLIRGKNIIEAKNFLKFQKNKGSIAVYDLLNSAIAIAKSSEVAEDSFYVTKVLCNDGPRLKRGKAASKGSVMPITKRQSHLILSISDTLKKSAKKSADKFPKRERKEKITEVIKNKEK